MKFRRGMAVFLAALLAQIGVAGAYEVPMDNSKAQYFYVFGPEASPLEGKEDSQFVLTIDVPKDASDQVRFDVFDPDTAGSHDKLSRVVERETVSRFTVSGTSVLATQEFNPGEYDNQYYQFGPFQKTQGRMVGDSYRFELKVEAVSGNGQNLFSVRVQPETAEAFTDDVTFRLRYWRDRVMFFYPEVAAGQTVVVAKNFDMDLIGGVSHLYDPYTKETVPVSDSRSGEWVETMVKIASGPARRLTYTINMNRISTENAGLRFEDESGKALPIFFKPSKTAPVAKPAKVKQEKAPKVEKKKEAPKQAASSCGEFLFDATDSFDADRDDLNYFWNFGDGTTSTEPVVRHVYTKGGAYEVSLKVTDGSGLVCNAGMTSETIQVNTPPKAGLMAPEKGCAEKTLIFDASSTRDDNPEGLTYHWDFSDGSTAEGKTVAKTFAKGGVYKAVLTVDDGAGTKCSMDSVSQEIRINVPPVANAGNDVTLHLRDANASYDVPFSASASKDADGDSLSYTWDFGDGSSGTGEKVMHTYNRPGKYTARLIVSDNFEQACRTDSDEVLVDLNKAPIANAGKDQSGCVGGSFFFDASDSTAELGETLTYAWDFGDGETASGAKQTHTYKKGGTYQVRLTVNDGQDTQVSNGIDGVEVRVNAGPTAILDSVKPACLGDKIDFDASKSSDPDGDSLSFTWDFGDGTVEKGGSKVSHQFARGGVYEVRVTVDDQSSSSCARAYARAIVEINTRPVANAGPNLVCCQEQVSGFDGSASSDPDGDKLSYKWSFGDGGTATDAKVSHAYQENGVYHVSLTVDDQKGTACSVDQSSFEARVNAKPVSVIRYKQD